MGNYRFKLSGMMPNAWFYKLSYVSRASTDHTLSPPTKRTHHRRPRSPKSPNPVPPSPPSFIPNRTSYYYPSKPEQHFSTSTLYNKASDTHFPLDPPRKSKRKTTRKPTKPSTKLLNTSVSSTCSCRHWKSESTTDSNSLSFNEEADLYQPITTNFAASINMDLPPILTKPVKKYVSTNPRQQIKSPRKRIHRLRVRASSPRLTGKALGSSGLSPVATRQQREGLSESFAVVKTSSDPQRDFKDSMVEMIIEHNIRASKDLEEMLACYLTLNSKEYHDVIVKVFEQIWFQIAEIIRL